MAMFSAVPSPDKDPKQFLSTFGPSHIDTMIRQSINFCWMMLPDADRTPDEVERQIRRIVDRAIKDFREDQDAFGKSPITE